MNTAPQNENSDWKAVSVELPVRYWIVALGAIDGFIREHIAPMIKESRKKGLTNEQLPDAQKAVIAGALSSRAAIVAELVKQGVMKPKADKQVGMPFMKEAAEIGRIHLVRKKNGKA